MDTRSFIDDDDDDESHSSPSDDQNTRKLRFGHIKICYSMITTRKNIQLVKSFVSFFYFTFVQSHSLNKRY